MVTNFVKGIWIDQYSQMTCVLYDVSRCHRAWQLYIDELTAQASSIYDRMMSQAGCSLKGSVAIANNANTAAILF